MIESIIFFGFVCFITASIAFRYSYDTLHPAIIFSALFSFVYVLQPLVLIANDSDKFVLFNGSEDNVITYEFIVLLIFVSLISGIYVGSRRREMSSSLGYNASHLTVLAGLVGLTGAGLSFFYLFSFGGISEVYGRAYGAVYIADGYISEARNMSVVAVPLLFIARKKEGMFWRHWALLGVIISPMLLQAILGARRGPLILVFMLLIGGYVGILRKKIPIVLAAVSVILVGYVALFLVSNRDAIYVGSKAEFSRGAFEAIKDLYGSEYVYGNSIMRYLLGGGDPFMGRRLFGHILARVIPSAWWPTKYEEVASYLNLIGVDFHVNNGVPIGLVGRMTGWMPAVGAAPGFVAEVCLEFGLAAPVFAFSIGYFFASAWIAARRESMFSNAVYLLMASMSVYLVLQSLEAFTYRIILFGIPTLLISRMVSS